MLVHSIAMMGNVCPLNSDCQLTVYSWPVTSLIMGPEDSRLLNLDH